MAAPPKNTVDYFPFICAEGKKMYYLEEAYGNDGFATFIKLLRELAKTEYHYLDLSNKTTKMFLSAKCKVSLSFLETIIKDLVDLGKFNAELWNDFQVIWCQDFIDSVADAYNRRTNECMNLDGLRKHLKSLRKPKQNKESIESFEKPQTILKKTKLEETRDKSAIDFVKSEKEIEYTDFEMQNKKLIPNWEKMLDNFNNKIDIEVSQNKIEWKSDQIMSRLRMYFSSWLENHKNSSFKNNQPIDNHKPKYI